MHIIVLIQTAAEDDLLIGLIDNFQINYGMELHELQKGQNLISACFNDETEKISYSSSKTKN
jgi:hypothetical protein